MMWPSSVCLISWLNSILMKNSVMCRNHRMVCLCKEGPSYDQNWKVGEVCETQVHTLCCRTCPQSNLHFNRVATQPSQQYNSLMLPEIFTVVAGMRHRRTTPRHLLFPRNSLQAARGPSYRSLCGLVVDGSAHFPTRWHPTNLAWLPRLKRQHAHRCNCRGDLRDTILFFPVLPSCLCSTSNMYC